MRNLELGTIEPSIRGWRKKLRANSRASPVRVRLGIGWLFDTLCSAWVMLIANSYIMRRFQPCVTVVSAARPLGVVAETAQLRDQPVAVLALNLDDSVPDGAPCAAESLQPAGERLEFHGGKRQARDHGDALAAAPRHFATDAHPRRGGPGGVRDGPGGAHGAYFKPYALLWRGTCSKPGHGGAIHRIPHHRLRASGDPGEAVLGHRQLRAPALQSAAREGRLAPEAAVRLPGGAAGGRAGGDRQGIRVRQGPVRDVHARGVEGSGGS